MENRRQLAMQRKAEEDKARALEEEKKIREENEKRKREREENTDKRPIRAVTKKVIYFRAIIAVQFLIVILSQA